MFVTIDEPIPQFVIQDPDATVFTGGGSAAPDPRPAPMTSNNVETVE